MTGNILMFVSMTVGYLTVSKKMGDRFCIVVGGILAGRGLAVLRDGSVAYIAHSLLRWDWSRPEVRLHDEPPQRLHHGQISKPDSYEQERVL
jgi:hypothetical protein